MAVLFVRAVAGCLLLIKPRRFGVAAAFALFLIVVAWYFSLKPSNDREWAADVAQIPSAELRGDQLTVHNVRNFDYRSEIDFTPRWETRTYNLSQLRGVDAMLVYWGSPAIAHAMVSFEFEPDNYLAVSIEARRQKSESYSAIQGFFRQFELIYVFSDERDVVRLRTNYRHEDVYLYHTTMSPLAAKALLLSYIDQANSLAKQAQFYNALTSNCATNVLENARAVSLPTQMSWKVLLSGYAAEQMYANGRIDTRMPYEQLKAASHVNEKANRADQSPEFSRQIREGLPVPARAALRVPATLGN
jgi:hypothetical protein